jgi:prepilin-type N-terminal cleavage/methylation domain-containing protein
MTTITEQYNNRKSSKRGFTLVEIIITMGLLTMIIAVGLSAVTFISQSSTALTNYSIMSTNGRQALEIMARDLRMGYNINEATSAKLDFDIYGKAGTTNNVVYTYDADVEKLYRSEDGGTNEAVMDDLSSFAFNYFNLRRESTTAKISIKEVQIEGLLKRNALRVNNTNHIISARFMMRNRSVSN